jgi:hypothetical protein
VCPEEEMLNDPALFVKVGEFGKSCNKIETDEKGNQMFLAGSKSFTLASLSANNTLDIIKEGSDCIIGVKYDRAKSVYIVNTGETCNIETYSNSGVKDKEPISASLLEGQSSNSLT